MSLSDGPQDSLAAEGLARSLAAFDDSAGGDNGKARTQLSTLPAARRHESATAAVDR